MVRLTDPYLRCRTCSNKINISPVNQQATENLELFNSGKLKHSKGYVLVKDPSHPRSHNGYVLEHVLIAEKKLGRPLKTNEVAHHINGIKDDNRPENIEVMTRSAHSVHHRNNLSGS